VGACLSSCLGGGGLGGRYGAQSNQHGAVDRPGIVEEDTDNFLDVGAFSGRQERSVVGRFGELDGSTILWAWVGMWRVDGVCGRSVGETLERSRDVTRHGDVDGACGVVPLEGHAEESCARGVDGDDILEAKGVDKMLEMFLACELDAKVIDDKGKRNGASGVAKEAVGVGGLNIAVRGKVSDQFVVGETPGLGEPIHAFDGLNIAVRGKVSDQFVVGETPGLGEPIHAFDDANKDVAIVDEVLQIVLGENSGRDLVDGDAHVLGVIHCSVEVKILDVNGTELRVRCGEDAVKEEFGGYESSGFGADVAGIVDAIATDGEADAARVAFVGTVSDDQSKIGGCDTGRNIGTLDEVDCVGADRALVALCKAANFFRTAFLPEGTVGTVQ